FDMWILYKNGDELYVEVKYESELQSNLKKHMRTQRQIEAQKEWCKQNGFKYEVRTERTIRAGRYRNENLLRIVSTISNMDRPDFVENIFECIDTSKKTLMKIHCSCLNYSLYEVLIACQWLYYEGLVEADISSKIWNASMEVWRIE